MYPRPERRQRVWRLRTRLLAPSLVVLLLGALVLLQIEELSAAWQAEALVSQRGASVLAGITKRIEERQHAKQIFAQLLADQGGLAEAVERRDPIGTAQLLVPLRTRLELGSIAVFNDDQSELFYTGHEEGRRLAARLRPTALTGLTPTAALIEGDGLVVGAATPIKGNRGIVGAIVVAGVLNSGALREVSNRTSVEIAVVRAGTLIGTSATDPQVRDLITSWAETADLSELNNALRHLGLQASAQSIADDGVLVALVPIHDLVAAAEQRNWIAVAGVTGLVLLMLIIGIVLARDIARPLQSIITAADAIVRGDYSRRTEPATIWELKHLASAFNNLAEQLGLQRARLDADLTRRKQAEAALARLNGELEQRIDERTAELGAAKNLAEREQATLAGVMASMTDGLIVLKGNGEVRYCNSRAALLLDTDPDQLIGRALASEIMASSEALESPAAVMRDLTEALARVSEQPSIEMVMSQPQRRDLQVQFFVVPGSASGESNIGLLLHDVSAVRDLERTKDELVSVVSHELRTPLASVVGFTQLLLARDFTEAERREFLKVMETEGLRLTALINDFLDLQRIESGREQISLTPVAIGAVLHEALTAFEGDERWPLSLELCDDLPVILADSERIRQVVINLVGNARKYSPNGGAIAVSARAVAGNVEVSVQDHGLGLPPTALPRLFEKFYR
ncbi:MAG: PAS domain-containing protein, partial [Chloroflexi bacterium]|nr:PAS domain-containing protein [Chloroflexota bacterium]